MQLFILFILKKDLFVDFDIFAFMKKYDKYIGKEDNFQIALATYLDNKRLLWFHPANERQLHVRISKNGKAYSPLGNKLKKKGVKSGVPDIIIFEPRGNYHGLMLELKVGYNKITPTQKQWVERLNKNNYLCKVTYSLDESVDIIKMYLAL